MRVARKGKAFACDLGRARNGFVFLMGEAFVNGKPAVRTGVFFQRTKILNRSAQ